MTFKNTPKESNLPLIHEMTNELLSEIQKRFLEFLRDFEEIDDYCNRITTFTIQDFNRKKNIITTKTKTIYDICQNLNNAVESISRLEIKDIGLKKKVKDQLQVVNERYIPKQNELPKIIKSIQEKEKKMTEKLGIKLDISNNSGIDKSNFDKPRESKIVLHEVIDNDQYLQKRQGQLEEIKKVAGQVKEISKAMGNQVAETGENLNRLEDVVVDANANANNAEAEINKAEKETRSTTKYILCLVFIILFVIVSIVLIFYFIFK